VTEAIARFYPESAAPSSRAAAPALLGTTPMIDPFRCDRAPALFALLAFAGCGGSAAPPDGGIARSDAAILDGSLPISGDGAQPIVDAAFDLAPDLSGAFHPPEPDDDPLAHAPATPIKVTTMPGTPIVLDVGADRGGGIWAVSASTVYYFHDGVVSTYDQSTGLARGNMAFPFTGIAGALPGQAIVGDNGGIADLMQVNPQNGNVQSIDNMVVPFFQGDEYPQHLVRVIAAFRIVADVDGTMNGTAYLGGSHGTTARHGLTGPGNFPPFEEHVHFQPDGTTNWCDSTVPPKGCWGGDVRGLALTPEGDLWIGDEHYVAFLPQLSIGPNTDFFMSFGFGMDVIPGVNDEVQALASDGSGALWIATGWNGLVRLAPMTHEPTYFDRARELPQNRLTAVAADPDGSIWVGTWNAGLARVKDGNWRYYTQASGLPSPDITSIFVDKDSHPRRVIIGSDVGVAIYDGE
jgi:hypothetical protein